MNFNWKTCIRILSLHCILLGYKIPASASEIPFSSCDEVLPPTEIFSRQRRAVEKVDHEENKFDSLVPSDYNLYELPPKINGEPTKMNFTVLLFNVRDVKEIAEEITLELNMQMQWKDPRVKPAAEMAARNVTKYLILKPSLLQKLWYPDLYIDHVKSVSQPVLVSKPASLRIYPDSGIRYSTRVTVTMSCSFDFHYYPADTQRCEMDLKSYAYTDSDLLLMWRAAAFAFEIEAPNFYVGMDKTETYTIKTGSGTYTVLRLTITLTRTLSYHLIQTYLPSFLLVIVSWLSFLVPSDSVPGRMAICMTCLLSLIAMFASVRQSIPNVSYVKALDIWMVACVFFVFLALAEFTIVLKLLSIKRRPKEKAKTTNVDPFTDQSIAMNHLNSMRGARGSVAQVYYPGGPQQPQHRLRRPSLPAPPILKEQNLEEDDESESLPQSRENVASSQLYGGPRMYGTRFPLPGAQSHSSLHGEPQAFRPMVGIPPPPAEKQIYVKLVRRLETYASIIVPTLFFAFNFIYWPWLIASSQYFDENDSTVFYSA